MTRSGTLDEKERFDERAGIYEFDAGLPREQAELLAWQEILQKRDAARAGESNKTALMAYLTRNGGSAYLAAIYAEGDDRGMVDAAIAALEADGRVRVVPARVRMYGVEIIDQNGECVIANFGARFFAGGRWYESKAAWAKAWRLR